MTDHLPKKFSVLDDAVNALLMLLRVQYGLDKHDKKTLNEYIREARKKYPNHEIGRRKMAEYVLPRLLRYLNDKNGKIYTQDEFVPIGTIAVALIEGRCKQRLNREAELRENMEENLLQTARAGVSSEGYWGDMMNLEGLATHRLPGDYYSKK